MRAILWRIQRAYFRRNLRTGSRATSVAVRSRRCATRLLVSTVLQPQVAAGRGSEEAKRVGLVHGTPPQSAFWMIPSRWGDRIYQKFTFMRNTCIFVFLIDKLVQYEGDLGGETVSITKPNAGYPFHSPSQHFFETPKGFRPTFKNARFENQRGCSLFSAGAAWHNDDEDQQVFTCILQHRRPGARGAP